MSELLSSSHSDTYWAAAIPGLFSEPAVPAQPVWNERDEIERDDGCLFNQEGELCLLSYFTNQHVPVPFRQRVDTWLDKIPEDELEPAVLELSLGGPSSSASHNQAEDIIETSLAILSHDLDLNQDEAMQQNDEFPLVTVEHNQEELDQQQYQTAYRTPSPIRGNFVPVSGHSPSSNRQVLQPVVYEPAHNNSSPVAHFTARASMDNRTSDQMASSTRSRSRSPVKDHGTPNKEQRRSRSLSPVKFSPCRQAPKDSIAEETSYHQDVNDTSFIGKGKYSATSTNLTERLQAQKNNIFEDASYHYDVNNDTPSAGRFKYPGSSPFSNKRGQDTNDTSSSNNKAKNPDPSPFFNERRQDVNNTPFSSKGKNPDPSPFFNERRQATKNNIPEDFSIHHDVNVTPSANKSKYPGTPIPIAERRNLAAPTSLNTYAANDSYATNQQARAVAIRKAGTASIVENRSSRILEEPVTLTSGSASPKQKYKPTFTGDDASSTYSPPMTSGLPTANSARVEPLFTNASTSYNIIANDNRRPENPVLGGYQDWLRGREKRQSGYAYPNRAQDQNAGSSSQQQDDLIEPVVETRAEQAGYRGIPYTPISSVFPGGFEASPRKASKTMIGAKGWLEDTSAPVEKATTTPKKTSFFTGFKTKAKAFMESTVDKGARMTAPKPDTSKSDGKQRELQISLDPREQSLLYCELEFIVHEALNNYITAQFNNGRLSTSKLDKINHEWQTKGRPKVVGFRYDLETQLEIVRVHAGEFRFYSRDASPATITGVVEMMQTNARAIRVRTYCQPDTVVSKQLLDAHSLLVVLGSSEDEKVQLAAITAFYRAVMERERSFHLRGGGPVVPSRSSGGAAAGPQQVVGPATATTPVRRRSVLGAARGWSSLANRATSPSSPLLEED